MQKSEYSWIDDAGKPCSMRMMGHKMLVRRCLADADRLLVGTVPAQGPDVPASWATAEAMLETYRQRGPVRVCEVLAVGDRCGQDRSDHEMKRFLLKDRTERPCYVWRGEHYAIPLKLNNPCRVGDFVILPETSKFNLMYRGVTGYEYDIMIDECEVLAFIRNDKEDI